MSTKDKVDCTQLFGETPERSLCADAGTALGTCHTLNSMRMDKTLMLTVQFANGEKPQISVKPIERK